MCTEAHVIKLACSEPPECNARWTLYLLAAELVTLGEIDFESISHEAIQQQIKNAPKPHLSSYREIPREQDADFIYYMEDVFALCHEPYDKNRPVTCFDKSSKALRSHECDPLPIGPGAAARVDHRHKRNEQRLHISNEPLTGWVNVEMTEKRRTTWWIDRRVELIDVHYLDANCVRVVIDQLNTHKPAAFHQFFPPNQARAYLDRLEFHYRQNMGAG